MNAVPPPVDCPLIGTEAAQSPPEARALKDGKFTAEFLGRLRFQVDVLIDVGVFKGTPELYAAYPDGKLVLIDPLPGFDETIRNRFAPHRVGREYDWDFHQVALGSAPGTMSLRISGGGSGLIPQLRDDPRFEGHVDVPVTRLDDLVAESGYEGRFGLKVDTEGFELEVLKGARETIPKCKFVIVETLLRDRFERNYRFSDLIAYMREFDFELLAVLNDKPDALNQYYDCLFLPYSHPIFHPRGTGSGTGAR
jgi:FkbM family methyltransferase